MGRCFRKSLFRRQLSFSDRWYSCLAPLLLIRKSSVLKQYQYCSLNHTANSNIFLSSSLKLYDIKVDLLLCLRNDLFFFSSSSSTNCLPMSPSHKPNSFARGFCAQSSPAISFKPAPESVSLDRRLPFEEQVYQHLAW